MNEKLNQLIQEVIPNYIRPISVTDSEMIIRSQNEYYNLRKKLNKDINDILGEKRNKFDKISINTYYHGLEFNDCETSFILSDEEIIKIKFKLGFHRILLNYQNYQDINKKLEYYKRNSIFEKIKINQNHLII